MASVTYSKFGANTEGLEVAKAFSDQVRGKTVLITGANKSGIGFAAAQAIASQSPARLILAGRNPSKLQECIDALKSEYPTVHYLPLQINLSSQQSVRKAAADILAWPDVPSIHLLINSAGIMGVQERTLTQDGIELTFATNHIGHWLLSCLIMPKLIKAAASNDKGMTRIVNISAGSAFFSGMRWSDMTFDKKNKDLPEAEQPMYEFLQAWGYADSDQVAYVPLDSYNRSKVANVLFGIGANKRLFDKFGILALAVHPGVIQTEIGRHLPRETLDAIEGMRQNQMFAYKSLAAGSSTVMVAALDPKLAVGVGEAHDGSENWGSLLADCQITGKARPQAVSSDEADRLWEVSEKLVGQSFSW